MRNSDFINFLHNKWVWLVIFLDMVVIVVLIVLSINKSQQSSIIVLNVAPIDAEISIDGQGTYQNGSYRITPGSHQVTISHPDLDSKTFTVDLDDQHTAVITTFLSKEGNLDFYKQRANYDSFNQLASIAAADHNATTDQDTSAESLISRAQAAQQIMDEVLPIESYNWLSDPHNKDIKVFRGSKITVNESYDCETWLCLDITAESPADEDSINTFLKQTGFNPEDYEIKYQIN